MYDCICENASGRSLARTRHHLLNFILTALSERKFAPSLDLMAGSFVLLVLRCKRLWGKPFYWCGVRGFAFCLRWCMLFRAPVRNAGWVGNAVSLLHNIICVTYPPSLVQEIKWKRVESYNFLTWTDKLNFRNLFSFWCVPINSVQFSLFLKSFH